MKHKRLKAVIFGPQGSGKGTQGELLADRFDVPLVGSGDLFRAEIANDTALGRLVKQSVKEGKLASDEVVNGIMGHQLKSLDLTRGFILDGYPRDVDQAQHLQRLLPPNVAIALKVSDAEAVKRLTTRLQCTRCKHVFSERALPPSAPAGKCIYCGGALVRRGDDTEDVIRARLASYHFMTEPLLRYYREHGILLQVNGEQRIEDVFEELVKKLAKLGFVA